MKYKTLDDFIAAAKTGDLSGVTVTVDNDSVYAYLDHGEDEYSEKIFDFGNSGPREVLIDILSLLGVNAEYP